MDGDMWQGCIMWQGVGACGRVWAHVVGDGRPVTMDRGIWQGGGDMWQDLGTCGRVWWHVAWGGGMWKGVGACGRG